MAQTMAFGMDTEAVKAEELADMVREAPSHAAPGEHDGKDVVVDALDVGRVAGAGLDAGVVPGDKCLELRR
jgi:hypothetical protein